MRHEIEKAVDWWTVVLAGPLRFDNGDAHSVAPALALLAAANEPAPTEGQLMVFKNTLREILAREAASRKNAEFHFWLGVDYGPCRTLAEAAEVAVISTFKFPWKTSMHIRPGSVTVALGYGTPFVELLEQTP